MVETIMPTEISRVLANIANSGAAPWVNRFLVYEGSMIKICFVEQNDPSDETSIFFRAAVTMSHTCAIELRDALDRVITKEKCRDITKS